MSNKQYIHTEYIHTLLSHTFIYAGMERHPCLKISMGLVSVYLGVAKFVCVCLFDEAQTLLLLGGNPCWKWLVFKYQNKITRISLSSVIMFDLTMWTRVTRHSSLCDITLEVDQLYCMIQVEMWNSM